MMFDLTQPTDPTKAAAWQNQVDDFRQRWLGAKGISRSLLQVAHAERFGGNYFVLSCLRRALSSAQQVLA